MPKLIHEVRDGIHGFLLFGPLEKRLIDSAPMQRLRCIHQLAMTYQVYPGATHKRFEHSLGVMDLSTRIFDQLFSKRLSDEVEKRIADELQDSRRDYWRRVVRIRDDTYGPKSETNDFLVQTEDGGVESSLQVSGVVATEPPVEIGLIFADPDICEKVKPWVDGKVKAFLNAATSTEGT